MGIGITKDGRYYIQYRIKERKSPVREYFGRGKDALSSAKIRDAEIALQKAHGEELHQGKGIYFDELAQLYIRDAKARNVSKAFLKDWVNILNKTVLPALTHTPVEKITYSDLLALAENQWSDVSVATRNRYLGYISAIFNFGIEHEITANNPLKKWKKAREEKRDLQLNVEDLKLLIKVAAPHLGWAIEVEWMCGARTGRSELLSLRWSDHDYENSTLHVRGTKTATSNRLIPLNPTDNNKLKEKRELNPSSKFIIEYRNKPLKKIRRSFNTAVEKAEINYPVRMYDIRHLWATELLRNGADLAAVSAMLGHASIRTTQQKYYHLMQGEKAKAVNLKPTL
ncbi:site-specific integrase [Maridesulfovibrio ferrireducens]|uniref:tyrosine-type recombinase/integrase n=1 Tax=Maridesulfovibrio ferrireducens TaxID=246191 RepID=UPI001A320952|nr:site-specific integrase [Maridesulfovibrio ferrireducens]MBI9112327.1 site-specific integrase [Maridesulfovibrio ferrireducens]